MTNERSREEEECDAREHPGLPHDREERSLNEEEKKRAEHDRREKALDKTLADSFPTSDPPSSIPDPEDSNAA
ncbi:MAG: hypothetical protein CXZ00_00575 [Acidobacteria bacterium]|nr:MAG: hypothetical protein CXZ00_00575 [Acidobacteriota bacterium]